MAVLELPAELRDVAIAFGLMAVPSGSTPEDAVLNDDFFVRPDHYVTGVLTQQPQRDAALRLAAQLADPSGAPVEGEPGEQWLRLAAATGDDDAVTSGLFLVTRSVGDDLLVSLGGQVERTAGSATVRLAGRVPLVLVGSDGASFAPGTVHGDVRVDATVVLEAATGDALGGLEQVVGGVTIPTDGRVPSASVRLVLPPAGDIGDIVVTTADAVGGAAAKVLTQLLTAVASAADDAVGDAASDLLALVGLDSAGQIPALPIDEIVAEGPRRGLGVATRRVLG